MKMVCLDLEGVLVPEIWIEFAEAVGIPGLKRTTRDEPDYDKLMEYRYSLLREAGLGISEIQATIAKMKPLEGAREFLDALREQTQVIIVSDTFSQFAQPLMKQLGWPTIFCNELIIGEDGMLEGHNMRKARAKSEVIALMQQVGFFVIAGGDSHNDLSMIEQADSGFLFRSTEELIAANPDVPAYESYDELLQAIESQL